MTKWRPVHVGGRSDTARIGVTRIWREPWRRTNADPIYLPYPGRPQEAGQFQIYEIGPAASPIRFAARELSNGVWGFYVPKDDWRYRVIDVVPAPGPGKILLLAGTTDLSVGTRVAVKLERPNEDVVETSGIKEWELPVNDLMAKHDAFRLPLFELSIPEGSLAEILQLNGQ